MIEPGPLPAALAGVLLAGAVWWYAGRRAQFGEFGDVCAAVFLSAIIQGCIWAVDLDDSPAPVHPTTCTESRPMTR